MVRLVKRQVISYDSSKRVVLFYDWSKLSCYRLNGNKYGGIDCFLSLTWSYRSMVQNTYGIVWLLKITLPQLVRRAKWGRLGDQQGVQCDGVKDRTRWT